MFREKNINKLSCFFIFLLSILLVISPMVTAQIFNETVNPLIPPIQLNPLFFTTGLSFLPFDFYSIETGLPYLNLNTLGNTLFTNPFIPLYTPVSELLNPLVSISSLMSLPKITYGFPAIEQTLLNMSNLPALSLAAAPIAPMRMAAQAGTWIGTWQSTFIAFIVLFNSGPMTLTLTENLILQTLSGTCILAGSRFTDTLIDVRGVITTPTFFELSGITAGGFALVLSCTLLSSTTMTGSYTVSSGFGGAVLDRGVFNLTLI